jgi:hypothetical protein
LGGRGRKITSFEASLGKVSKTLSQEQNTKQKGWGCGQMVEQERGPGFNF